MRATQGDGAFGDLPVDLDDGEPVEEGARAVLQGGWCADQHLHPSDNADRLVLMPAKFRARLRDTAEVVDQDVGIEQRLHHSARTFFWYFRPSVAALPQSPKASSAGG